MIREPHMRDILKPILNGRDPKEFALYCLGTQHEISWKVLKVSTRTVMRWVEGFSHPQD